MKETEESRKLDMERLLGSYNLDLMEQILGGEEEEKKEEQKEESVCKNCGKAAVSKCSKCKRA